MRMLSAFLLLALVFSPLSIPAQMPRTRPGIEDARKVQDRLAVEPPREAVRSAIDPAKLKAEATDFAKLTATVQQQLQDAANGLLPKDLEKNLRELEKMARHLRSEVSPR